MTEECFNPLADSSVELSPEEQKNIKVYEEDIAIQALISQANLINYQKLINIDVDYDKLSKKLETSATLSPSLHEQILNLVASQILSLDKKSIVRGAVNQIYTYQDYKSTDSEGVHNVFSVMKVLSDNSEETILKSSLFVIKTPKPKRKTSLAHEAVIGLLAVNIFKLFVPNFAYCYGFGNCSLPIYSDKEVVSFCDTDNKSSFLVLEDVKNSVTLRQYIKDCNIFDFSIVFLQILNALNLGQNICKYVHHNLHGDNILVRTFKEPVSINLFSKGMNIISTISSKYVPYIIDYGSNSIQYNDLIFSSNSGSVNNWAYDLLSLLTSMYKRSNIDSSAKIQIMDYLWNELFFTTFGVIQKIYTNSTRNIINACENISKKQKFSSVLNWLLNVIHEEVNSTGNELNLKAITSQKIKYPYYTTCDFYKEFTKTGYESIVDLSRHLDAVSSISTNPLETFTTENIQINEDIIKSEIVNMVGEYNLLLSDIENNKSDNRNTLLEGRLWNLINRAEYHLNAALNVYKYYQNLPFTRIVVQQYEKSVSDVNKLKNKYDERFLMDIGGL
jgi:hypothetical protein